MPENIDLQTRMECFLNNHIIEGMSREWIEHHYLTLYDEISTDPEMIDANASQIIEETETYLRDIIVSYEKVKLLGHSDAFSQVYAEKFFIEENDSTVKDAAYRYLYSLDKNISYEEKSKLIFDEAYIDWLKQGKDPIECNKYAQEISHGEFDSRATEKAEQYFHYYKSAIENGDSSTYSNIYADSLSSGDPLEFAQVKARTYEEQILEGNGEEYSEYYADKFADKFFNADARGLIETDLDRLYYKMIARVQAYIHFNKETYNLKIYGDIYENIYLNYFFSPASKDKDFVVHEDLEKEIEDKYYWSINR
ncbi:hypothetical protein [Sphaerochaeta globosa]|uniref:Uncharacterized protein n=1 Tax=Sphaerochaeta globosa (strain ATCC BAA-1886 / DSM 22777 / Buddy) TaxID=158189 RepID=F0RRE2_SPHGB|nr:hypothetical protein [Sphaerochaeta globosa]ADY14194.1 hypothetical protein SpiBuddy_2380 [Sphaerochaeta globosa str. Buddy]